MMSALSVQITGLLSGCVPADGALGRLRAWLYGALTCSWGPSLVASASCSPGGAPRPALKRCANTARHRHGFPVRSPGPSTAISTGAIGARPPASRPSRRPRPCCNASTHKRRPTTSRPRWPTPHRSVRSPCAPWPTARPGCSAHCRRSTSMGVPPATPAWPGPLPAGPDLAALRALLDASGEAVAPRRARWRWLGGAPGQCPCPATCSAPVDLPEGLADRAGHHAPEAVHETDGWRIGPTARRAARLRAEPRGRRRRGRRPGGLQLHRVARSARADPRRRRFHAHRQGRLRRMCSTASATTTWTACSVPRRA